MNCPEHLAFKIGGLYVWMYYYDVPKKNIPFKIWLNPLRYQISYYNHQYKFKFCINREGHWRVKVSNVIFNLKKHLRLFK